MSWQNDAACAGLPVEWWFSDSAPTVQRARWICSWCPHIVRCLDDAQANGDHGMRGGLTYKERAKTRRQPVIHEVRQMTDVRSRLIRKAS